MDRALMSLRRLGARLPGGAKRLPEDSVALRSWVLAAVLVGEAAVLSSGYFDVVTGVLVPVLTVVAFAVSYLRRRERNFLIKVLLAFGALAALAMFFREVLGSLYDTRIPLARLFLWVQVIHAFDLPARKDLSYSWLPSAPSSRRACGTACSFSPSCCAPWRPCPR
jgi:hypothetical protein